MKTNPKQTVKTFVFSGVLTMSLFGVVNTVGANAANAKTAKAHVALQEEGITIWKVPVANSNMLGFKAQAVVNANVNRVFNVVKDIKNSHKWVPNTKEAKVIQFNENKGYGRFYFVIDMPFPLSDRDLVVASKLTKEANGNILIENKGITDAVMPPRKGFIRIKHYTGNWYLEKLSQNKTRVTFDGHANPEGGIPSWVANMFVTKQPFDTMRNLRKQVKKTP